VAKGKGGGGQEFDVIPGKEFKRVADALRVVDTTLPAKFRKELKAAAKPLVAAAKANAKNIQVKTPDQRALRRKVAAGVAVQVSTGRTARIRIVTKMTEPSMAVIPRGLESSKGWRHPVFGHDIWVTQKPEQHWFMTAMQEGKSETMERIRKVIEEAAKFIASHGGA
jgi:hypothetical protein